LRQALVFFALALGASGNASPLFEDDAVLQVKLSGPLSTLIKNKKNRVEYPFTLTIGANVIDMQVRVRGNSRLVVCRFPPLRLRFPEGDVTDTVFDGQGKVKLVTHCKSDSVRAENNVLDEYLVYRLFNLVSSSSYRVRLLQLSYEDTDGKLKDLDRLYYGFLIESDQELASRAGGQIAEITGVRYSLLDQDQTALMSVFQYLIGNTDWSLLTAYNADTCCHNVDLFDVEGRLLPVPYDFDFSGVVNAIYAEPNPNLRIKRVTQRRFRGYCKSSIDTVAAAARKIVAMQDQILAMAKEVPALKEKYVSERIRFLGHFFEEAEDQADLIHNFDRHCIGPS
jgi:hypothetical protein